MNKFIAIILSLAVGLLIVFNQACGRRADAQEPWPPVLGETFSDQIWTNYDGNQFKVSDFKGKVILVEFVGMPCSACQAFSGGYKKGGFGAGVPQADLQTIEEYFFRYSGGIQLTDDRVIFIQILLYSMSMGPPGVQDAKQWAQHFGLDRHQNTFVAVSPKSLVGPESFALIPGFALLDDHLMVRALSTGDNPKQNLYTQLLPMVSKLILKKNQ